ncbi:hypothetical protein AnigIFM63604_003296 [Aspergillus niger]|uniref:Uncharacterized protein n=1 Tax=Aspergillus niger TaxID=5061 RepID=A0A9W6A915_ASPNG|nr:hypothetical protein AnigIFM63604_003296 [Aspergillus niger]
MAISRYPLRGCGVSIRPSIEGLAQALFERLVFFFCSLVPDVCRYPFEGVVYLSRYRVSLREFDGLLVLVPALFEGLVALSQPLSPSGVRFILADIGDVSLREFDGLLNLVFSERIWSSTSCSSSLRESGLQPLAVSPRESGLLLVCSCFRLVIFSIDRLKPPPPSVSVSPPPSMFAMSQPEIADRFPSPLQKPEYHCLPVFRRNISSLKDANVPVFIKALKPLMSVQLDEDWSTLKNVD